MNEMAHFRLDQRAIVRSFNRSNARHAEAAQLPRRIGEELLQRLQYFPLTPRVALDLGCGVGLAALQMRRRYRGCRVLALDSAYLRVRAAHDRRRFWRRVDGICADARALPLRAGSVDLVYSNLMLHWCEDPSAVFAEVQRVLRPGGLMLFSTLGPETLHELREAWAGVDAASHVSAFADMPQLAAAMTHAGMHEPVMDRDVQVAHYADVHALMHELRALGAAHAASDRRRTLTGRARLQSMVRAYERSRTAAGVPASYEVIYGAVFAGERAAAARAGEYAVDIGRVRLRADER